MVLDNAILSPSNFKISFNKQYYFLDLYLTIF